MIQPDYAPISKLLLAYPERFYNAYDELVPFYDELISLVPNDLLIWIITNNNQTIEKLESKFSHKNIKFLGIKGWDEIWLRDVIGLNKKGSVIKPKYAPAYCQYEAESEHLNKINKLSRRIIKECLEKDIIDINLNLDCGNFVCNEQYAFLTDKILEQNATLFPKEIEIIIKKATGLQPIYLNGNNSDNIGHTDAYLNFVNNDTALLSSYPTFPFLKDDLSFIKSLEQDLKVAGVKIKTIYDRPVYENGYCGCSRKNGKPCFYSARGIYSNFLRLNKTILLPEFKLTTKKENDYYNKVNQQILEDLGFEVLRINCDRLGKFGGLLHCISFVS
jgi:agmatine/peptidylarginine deiminase